MYTNIECTLIFCCSFSVFFNLIVKIKNNINRSLLRLKMDLWDTFWEIIFRIKRNSVRCKETNGVKWIIKSFVGSFLLKKLIFFFIFQIFLKERASFRVIGCDIFPIASVIAGRLRITLTSILIAKIVTTDIGFFLALHTCSSSICRTCSIQRTYGLLSILYIDIRPMRLKTSLFRIFATTVSLTCDKYNKNKKQ